ncbi:MAG: D-aminoacyl-tRNA deacylase [Planctomycetota bacterium]|jgi:D-tyrosyl-tRNA(Tyr) deacylase
MIAVVQRVREASVTVKADGYHAQIGRGLCVLLAVERGDTEQQADWMAKKLAQLRLFPDEQDKINRSVLDIRGEMLLISQFTLAGDPSKGNRPSFVGAAEPDLGRRLYERVADRVRVDHGVPVSTGVFGAAMLVSLVNDGPVTLIVQKKV